MPRRRRKCSNDGYSVRVTLSMAWMLCILEGYLNAPTQQEKDYFEGNQVDRRINKINVEKRT